MRRSLLLTSTASAVLAWSSVALAHGNLDHQGPTFTTGVPSSAFQSGGRGAQWELVKTFPTGNPHTDLDFFTQEGKTYTSVGTLGTGPNGGGQTIFQLTQNGSVDPSFVSNHPSAACPSNPASALGLQHDVEATPKGNAILNASNAFADRSDAQLILDASDAEGRCHDGGAFGVSQAPQGGIEIVDITDIENPKEIGLTSHIGEAHTVNIDPKRPHIAYAVTSDAVSLNPDGSRQNEDPSDSDRYDLDGFEVIDLSSCMNFPAGTTIAQKREGCRPEVFRYRYPSASIAMGHTKQDAIYGCHELEVYANDLLTCGSGAATILFDMSGAFDTNGTPRDFSDDHPRGTPLPCRLRPSSSEPPYASGAAVTDCVVGVANQDLTIPAWRSIGAPSLEGVRYVGSAHHQGRGGPYGSQEDIDFDHEAELTASGKYIIATDERGGGVTPPGATCPNAGAGANDSNEFGNGGLHAYAVSRLDTTLPTRAEEAWDAYARTPDGKKAIFRATPRVPAPSFCTAHVFQQIPGQNRIFMGWYTQGTQVVDFIEHRDGTIEFKEAGYFIPTNANTWVSHVFKTRKNRNGTFTYWGATGDFNLGAAGRSAVDIYKVTLPAPPGSGSKPKAGASTQVPGP